MKLRVPLADTKLSDGTQRDLARIRVLAKDESRWASLEANTARYSRAQETLRIVERIARRERAF
jgi:hypothetical protein